MRERYGLKGYGFRWKHDTMDSEQAAAETVRLLSSLKPELSPSYVMEVSDIDGVPRPEMKRLYTLRNRIAIIDRGRLIACEPTAQLIGRLDQKTLVVRPNEALSVAPAGFEDLHTTLHRDGALAITYSTREHSVEELLDRVRRAGVSIRDLSIQEPDLEDVFVKLTAS